MPSQHRRSHTGACLHDRQVVRRCQYAQPDGLSASSGTSDTVPDPVVVSPCRQVTERSWHTPVRGWCRPASGLRIRAMGARRNIPALAVLVLCLGACAWVGSGVGSSSGHPAAVPSFAGSNRTIVLDPSTGRVVDAGYQASGHAVIMDPSTGQLVEPEAQGTTHVVIMDPVTGQTIGVSN